MDLKIISAGAGSGKTYRLTQEMVALLNGSVRASGIIATTFTQKAAAELQERVRIKLLEEGMTEQANELSNALIGTVHGLGVKLLKRFAFEAGVSPVVDIMAEEDQQVMFNNSLATVLTHERISRMEHFSDRLGLNKRGRYDWRRELKGLTDIARANDFSTALLEKSKQQSIASFTAFLDPISSKTADVLNQELLDNLEETLAALSQNEDETKVTKRVVDTLRTFQQKLRLKGELDWHEWVKIAKVKPGARSRDLVLELKEAANSHLSHPAFHGDIKGFLTNIFDIAIAAIEEYEAYKKQRGLIDYIDMEIHVKRLLDNQQVQAILAEELDLLMVDEFQDTNPIQLEIFLKLSKIAKYAVWVGDPKQSIYGFRGAEPRLMQAIIEVNGGVKEEDIQEYSWRSREDIVHTTNALFCKAFSDLPERQVALKPKRLKIATADSQNKESEPLDVEDAIHHWHFEYDGEGRPPGRPWLENCIANAIQQMLDRQTLVLPKGEEQYRPVRPGDFAILCRSNAECQEMAEALHRSGLKAAIARTGLLNTAEARLILACLKYILNAYDSLSVAEILLLAEREDIEHIIDDRLDFLNQASFNRRDWAKDKPYIQKLQQLREAVVEMSSAEILNLVIEGLDLRRIIASWGKRQQRLDNVDVLRKLALRYEENCNRLHTAASLAGFLLWLNDLEAKGNDDQGSGESEEAVNVLTYHKSKGLEWPVVICTSLEGQLRDKVWGMDMVSEMEEVDLDNLLGHRWIRYWNNPYADQFQNTLLQERINASPFKARAKTRALSEEARLLYVGITRARDYLIFPTRSNATKWLNRCWHAGQEEYPTLDHQADESPWEWAGKVLYKSTRILPFPRDFAYSEPKEEALDYLEASQGLKSHPRYYLDIENLSIKTSVKGTRHYHPPFNFNAEELSSYQVAQLLQAFFHADHLDYPAAERLAIANDLLAHFSLAEDLQAKQLLQSSQAFYTHLQQYSPIHIHRDYPIRTKYKKQVIDVRIDCLLEASDAVYIFLFSDFSGTQNKWRHQAKELAPDLWARQLAAETLFKGKVLRPIIHFILEGGLVELKLQAQKAKPAISDPSTQGLLF
ncbi:MAG: UvrD-helicase domain-containing protein [Bacteroidota bacterium]